MKFFVFYPRDIYRDSRIGIATSEKAVKVYRSHGFLPCSDSWACSEIDEKIGNSLYSLNLITVDFKPIYLPYKSAADLCLVVRVLEGS